MMYETFINITNIHRYSHIYIYTHIRICLQIISTSEVLVPAIMMLTLCIVHSHIVSTHSGPTIGDGQNKQKVVRRLRHTRCRIGKSRTRQNLRRFFLL